MGKHIHEEAQRCLLCKKPQCSAGCPVGTPVNEMIRLLLANQIQDAGKLLFENNPLSVVCSLICPHEKNCEGHCILGKKGAPVQVSSIEHYISSYHLNRLALKPEKKPCGRIAVIGSGPSGLTVAFVMAQRGYSVTVFEAEEKIGGVLRYGIPEYRLPKDLLDRLQDHLISMGVKIRPNTLIGPVISLDDLFRDGYQAIFIGTGVWSPKPLRIPGETLGHVHFAINYLKNPGAFRLGDKVAVIGAGNVAMDVARTALRQGAREVSVLYRRGEDSITASRYEYEYAKLDGVRFEYFTAPVEIVDEGIRVVTTKEQPGTDGRVEVVSDEKTLRLFEADSVIIAVSQNPRSNIVASTKGIEINGYGLIITDETGRTSREGVFASGDVVTGARTVVEAVHFSKLACDAMEESIRGRCKDLQE